MKNLIKNTVLGFSLLGFATLTACGQTENTQKETTKVEELVKEDSVKNKAIKNISTTQGAPNKGNTRATDIVTTENTEVINMDKQKTLTTPSDAPQVSTVSLGAEQADDDLFSIDLTSGGLAASKAEEAKIDIESNELDKTGEELDITNNDKRKTGEELDITNNDKRKTNEGKRITNNDKRKTGEVKKLEIAKLKAELAATTKPKGVKNKEKKTQEQ